MCKNYLEGIEVIDNIKTSIAHLTPKVTVAVLRFPSVRQSVGPYDR